MAKPMNKSQLLQHLAEATGKTRKEVSEFMDLIVATAYSEAKKNGEFTIPGLGKLQKKDRAARMGRNPATGEAIKIKASKKVAFRAAKELKLAV